MDITRRNMVKLVGAVMAAPSAAATAAVKPKDVEVYLVKAELKCTAEQARIVEAVLRGLGKEFKADKWPEDWVVIKSVYGAWEG